MRGKILWLRGCDRAAGIGQSVRSASPLQLSDWSLIDHFSSPGREGVSSSGRGVSDSVGGVYGSGRGEVFGSAGRLSDEIMPSRFFSATGSATLGLSLRFLKSILPSNPSSSTVTGLPCQTRLVAVPLLMPFSSHVFR